MNKVELIGRLTKEPELKLTSNQVQFCAFTVAVDRKFKDANGQRQADFISCLAWKNTAVFIQKYFHKGNRIGITGSIQVRSFDNAEGKKCFITEVIAEEVEFVESSTANANSNPAWQNNAQPQVTQDQPQQVQSEAGGGNELPFEM